MNAYEAILKRRTVRKFKQDKISMDVLKKLVDAARLAPQGANLQPMKYIIVTEKSTVDKLFETVGWAAYLKPLRDPKEGERPVAYIVALVDTEIRKTAYDLDAGLAVENMLIAAVGEGLGTCMLSNIDREKIASILSIQERYIIHSMIATGLPAEQPVPVDENGSMKYYPDENGLLHVPKRRLDDVILDIRE